MAEAMSEERRAEIRAATDRERWNTHCGHVGPRTMVTELLDEVERLQTQSAYMREQIEQQAQVIEERKTQTVAYRALAEEHQKRGDKLSAQLAEIGETREEFGVRTYDNDEDVEVMSSRVQARDLAEAWRHEIPDSSPRVMVRTRQSKPGEWREVPNA